MVARDQLTNEQLKSLFKSNFELANYAMQMARYLVAAGHETSVEAILAEIIKNPKHYGLDELADMIQDAKTSRAETQNRERPERERSN